MIKRTTEILLQTSVSSIKNVCCSYFLIIVKHWLRLGLMAFEMAAQSLHSHLQSIRDNTLAP